MSTVVICVVICQDLWFVTLVKWERAMRSIVVFCVVICHDLRFVTLVKWAVQERPMRSIVVAW